MPHKERSITEPPLFTPAEVKIVHNSLASLDLLEVCNSISGSTIPEASARTARFSSEEYAQAAILCLKDGEQQMVEEYFVETGLVDVTDLYRALGGVSVHGKREKTILSRALVTLAGNKAVLNRYKT